VKAHVACKNNKLIRLRRISVFLTTASCVVSNGSPL